MAISGASGPNQPQNFVTKFMGRITKSVNHSPERRQFLKTLAAGGAGGAMLTVAGEKTMGWIFAKDTVVEDLKNEVIPLIKIGSKEEAKKLINIAITIHSENGDYERVGRIALLAKELDGEKVANPQLDMPSPDQMQEFRSERIKELAQNMDNAEVDDVVSSLIDNQSNYPKTAKAIQEASDEPRETEN